MRGLQSFLNSQGLDHSYPVCESAKLRARRTSRFPQYVLSVISNRLLAQVKMCGNLLAGVPQGDQAGDFNFTTGERWPAKIKFLTVYDRIAGLHGVALGNCQQHLFSIS